MDRGTGESGGGGERECERGETRWREGEKDNVGEREGESWREGENGGVQRGERNCERGRGSEKGVKGRERLRVRERERKG